MMSQLKLAQSIPRAFPISCIVICCIWAASTRKEPIWIDRWIYWPRCLSVWYWNEFIHEQDQPIPIHDGHDNL